jgi:hypothetical protein
MQLIKKQQLEQKKNYIGLVGTVLEVTDDIPGNSFSASMQTNWKKIRINYEKELNLIPDKKTREFAKKSGIKDPELKIGEDILDHECGHRENRARTTFGCPYDVETHDRIKSEIAKALESKGKKSETGYVTNAFEDILDNINCRNHTDFAGQTLFWNNQGLTRSENNIYNPFYEAFVKINLSLGSEKKSYGLLSRFFSKNEKVSEAVNGFLENLCEEAEEKKSQAMHKKQGFNKLFTKDLEERRQILERLAYSFALKTSDLLEESRKEQMFGASNSNGSGTSNNDSDNGNPFDKEMKDPQVQEKIAKSRYSSGKGPSYHIDLQEQLYSLYKAISKDIRIETSKFSASQSMPLVYFGKKLASDDEKKIRFRGVGFDSEGNLGFKTTRYSLDFPAAYKKHPTQFPNLKIAIMDRSGSMAQSPEEDDNVGNTDFIPWGDKSKYHFALKGYFGIDNYLERQGVSAFIDCSVLGLSGENSIKGKSKEVAKKLLHEPEGKYTSLDTSQLENELNENALLISISDGQVSIPSDKSNLENKLKKCDYVHFQIGNRTSFSDYIKSLGKPVIPVKGDDDLSFGMISFVSKYYQNKGQSQEAKK